MSHIHDPFLFCSDHSSSSFIHFSNHSTTGAQRSWSVGGLRHSSCFAHSRATSPGLNFGNFFITQVRAGPRGPITSEVAP